MNVRFGIVSGMPDLDHLNALPNVVAVLHKPFKLTRLDEVLNGGATAA